MVSFGCNGGRNVTSGTGGLLGKWSLVYHGDRVVEETNDGGGTLARYTTESGSYYAPMWHLQRHTGESRFPLYGGIGSARRLVDGGG